MHFFDFRIPADAGADSIAEFPGKRLLDAIESVLNFMDALKQKLALFCAQADIFIPDDLFHTPEVDGVRFVKSPVIEA